MGFGDCFASLAMTRRGIKGDGVTRYFDYQVNYWWLKGLDRAGLHLYNVSTYYALPCTWQGLI